MTTVKREYSNSPVDRRSRLLTIVTPFSAAVCVENRTSQDMSVTFWAYFVDKESRWRASARIYSHPVYTWLRSLTCFI